MLQSLRANSVKRCSKCRLDKTLNDFCRMKRSRDGYNWSCRSCNSSYMKQYYVSQPEGYREQMAYRRKMRGRGVRRFLVEYLSSHPCVKCGFNKIPALQFDHLRDKKYVLSQMTKGYSIETVKAEIAKCRVLCANCHAMVTSEQLDWYSKL